MQMNVLRKCAWSCCLGAALLAGSALAQSITVADIPYSASVALGGQPLQLNGAGVRYKAVFKVYTIGLYLTSKATSAEEAYAAPGPKRISMTLLREIDSNELGKAFTKGFQENAPKEQMSKLIPGLIRQGDIFAAQKKLVANDTITLDWVPGTGTIISVKGVAQGAPIKEPEFFVAMMRIWLGQQPADWKLKEALLGKT